MIDTTFFKNNLNEGKKGETLVSSFLISIGYQVEDVSHDPEFQKRDIDLIAGKEVGERMTIEVKSDSMVSRTGNICIETIGNIGKNKKGWLYYCQASHLFIVDVVNNIIYCVRFKEFFDMYQANKKRYRHIRNYEEYLYENGYRIVKIFLNLSKDKQKERFLERLDTPSKNWKFSGGDLKTREKWDEYRKAYEKAVNETATKENPWYVLPADQKWYTRYLVSEAIVKTLEEMNPQYPEMPEEEKAKIGEYREALNNE